MLCLKTKKKKFLCINKNILISIVYALFITFILLFMDKLYSVYNHYFIFEYKSKEFFKLFFLILFISGISRFRIRLFLFFTLTIFSLFQYIHFSYFGKNIAAIEFYLFFTNINETFETLNNMLSLVFMPLFIVTIGFIGIYIIDKKLKDRIYTNKYTSKLFILGLIYLSVKVFYVTNIKTGKLLQRDSKIIYPLTNRHSSRNFYVSINYFLVGILPKKIFGSKSNFKILDKPTLINKDINRTIVLIIGESLRYDTSSLYNNKLTPNLQKFKEEESNFYYKKVYSGGTMTKVSMSVLINRLKYPQSLEQITNENNCIYKLAKENNIDTYFITAQKSKHLQMIRDMICPKYIDNLIARDDFSNYIVASGYDQDLETILNKKDILNKNNLIVLQQRGSHSPYSLQYPDNYNLYKPYENTVLYTDEILSNLFKYIQENANQETFVFFVSDHGELLGENGKRGHGHLHQKVYEVPFMMYTNSKNKNIKKIFDNIHSQYDISNYIISLLGYDVDLELNKDRSIYIMNSDLDGFSGYGHLNIINGVESKIKIDHN